MANQSVVSNVEQWLKKIRPKGGRDEPNQGLQGIYRILERYRKNHTLIYVSIPEDEEEVHQSIILNVDPFSRCIDIDELFPGNITLFSGQRLNITLKEEGHRTLAFETQMITTEQENNYTSYTLALPEFVQHEQRRAAFRLPVRGNATWGEKDQRGRILDLSVTGVQIRLNKNVKVQPGDRISDCRMEMPRLKLDCDISVARIIEDEEQKNGPLIGAQLTSLQPSQQRHLERYLMTEQRRRRIMQETAAGF
ncbi:hypothetical protein HBA55_09785 [Pseudomaricurvus alkylphenolicus]|uniref:PilZ domain-containing protein n=1 Tax=Pseudomaricurvus alkylphenolicus TaxID=1306991 RepID=UPI001424A065|nr:hypothetical protein [Pseudomaricurvus alkylphenolicus]